MGLLRRFPHWLIVVDMGLHDSPDFHEETLLVGDAHVVGSSGLPLPGGYGSRVLSEGKICLPKGTGMCG